MYLKINLKERISFIEVGAKGLTLHSPSTSTVSGGSSWEVPVDVKGA